MKQVSSLRFLLFVALLLLLSVAFARSVVEKKDEKNATGDFTCGVDCNNGRCCAYGENCCSGTGCCRSGQTCCGYLLCCDLNEYAAFVNAHAVRSRPAALAN
ncbi:uncharacterized protein LOC116257952 isoform X3 [Nymphaea colorata]|nr:uncharacterized protein LOC116257947 [Nymphaea colorata]XP_031490837.1 uncharacterized protein LOC116257952 isoform X2 [Nymphaea colorata]XP_031490838.1 uncharacterized protein LOC116257952 isoform X1 [Nymphaea colorata]XP_031490853.1 uncharacterized protein LOC116257962 [Nymphaea colorata]XP_049934554.1 uncharacterized protein LOC116257952 isoform X3 [Nymphaea colorata]